MIDYIRERIWTTLLVLSVERMQIFIFLLEYIMIYTEDVGTTWKKMFLLPSLLGLWIHNLSNLQQMCDLGMFDSL